MLQPLLEQNNQSMLNHLKYLLRCWFLFFLVDLCLCLSKLFHTYPQNPIQDSPKYHDSSTLSLKSYFSSSFYLYKNTIPCGRLRYSPICLANLSSAAYISFFTSQYSFPNNFRVNPNIKSSAINSFSFNTTPNL